MVTLPRLHCTIPEPTTVATRIIGQVANEPGEADFAGYLITTRYGLILSRQCHRYELLSWTRGTMVCSGVLHIVRIHVDAKQNNLHVCGSVLMSP